MKLYMIRHGATDSNLANRAMGTRVDESINEFGQNQIRNILNSLPDTADGLYASPMKRAQETAIIVAEKYELPIITDANLVERDKGTLDGKTWTEIAEESHGAISVDLPSAQWDFGPYGGEPPEHVELRIREFLKTLSIYSQDSTIIAVTHSGIIHTMYHMFLHTSIRDVENGSVHEFTI